MREGGKSRGRTILSILSLASLPSSGETSVAPLLPRNEGERVRARFSLTYLAHRERATVSSLSSFPFPFSLSPFFLRAILARERERHLTRGSPVRRPEP